MQLLGKDRISDNLEESNWTFKSPGVVAQTPNIIRKKRVVLGTYLSFWKFVVQGIKLNQSLTKKGFRWFWGESCKTKLK